MAAIVRLVAAAVVAPLAVLASAAGSNGPLEVSVRDDGADHNGFCEESAVSSDGKTVVFRTNSTDLLSGLPDSADRIFLRDLKTGTTSLVSREGGVPYPSGSYNPKVSSNGRFVLFQTYTPADDPPDGTETSDLYLLDRRTGDPRVVSVGPTGDVGNADSFLDGASLSANGRFVAFYSSATNLTDEGGSEAPYQVFLLDAKKGTIVLVSKNAAGSAGSSSSGSPSISANGRYVVFETASDNLVAGSSNGSNQVYRYDAKKKTLLHASPGAAGSPADGNCGGAVVANTGVVAFVSGAGNLLFTPDVDEGSTDVFLRDPRGAGTTTALSRTEAGADPAGGAEGVSIAQNGKLVVFSTTQPLAAADGGDFSDVYSVDVKTGAVVLVSRNAAGGSGNFASYACSSSLAASGKWVSYRTFATDIFDMGSDDSLPDIVLVDPRR